MPQTLSAKSLHMMKELQTVDFAMLELTLHLNNHPEDLEALQQYNAFAGQRKGVTDKVDAVLGTLSQTGERPEADNWPRNDAPWPWQM
jgi:spore coat protein JB